MANIVSLGQLDEAGSKVEIHGRCLRIYDSEQRLLARVQRSPSRLYYLTIDVVRPVCLAARCNEPAWRWHARYGHLNFQALRQLHRQDMVHGLPPVDQVNQVCDACLMGKQKRAPFPQQSRYRAEHCLDLVHGDICCLIEPATPSGKHSFLLLIDDMSRYIWIKLIGAKSEAASTIKVFKAQAELECGRKLRSL